VVIKDGKIAAVGAKVSVPSGAQVINAKGLEVYPGLFNAVSQVGLVEVGQGEPGTVDLNELGDFNPQIAAATAVHPASEHIPVVRAAGITHTVSVPAFALDAYPVTNGGYLQFLRDGGYEDRSLWAEADWEWKTSAGIQQPRFWIQRGEQWYQSTMFGELLLPLNWPVYVSHAEASAYARWKGKALPTEAQWHRAAYGTAKGGERAYPWGDEPPQPCHGNFDFQRWTPTPVNAHPAGASAFGVADLLGNGWEWTSTVFGPFPGFEPFAFYPGYSANFFDDKHYVMKGGSARTATCMLRRSFRNWFQAHYQYIYATFRCVEN